MSLRKNLYLYCLSSLDDVGTSCLISRRKTTLERLVVFLREKELLFVLFTAARQVRNVVFNLPPLNKFGTSCFLREKNLGNPVQLRRSSRLKMPSKRSDFEGKTAEGARVMFKSRAGYIGTVTRLQGNIEELMKNFGTLEDLKSKRKSYDEVWRKFVSTHEEYIECLELLCHEEELERARITVATKSKWQGS